MKKLVLLSSVLLALTGCETLNSTYSQIQQTVQSSLGVSAVSPTSSLSSILPEQKDYSSCVTSDKGFEKFYNCSLYDITRGSLYDELRDEVVTEFGRKRQYALHDFFDNSFDYLINDGMVNDSKMQEIVSYLGRSFSFGRTAGLVKQCETFNESDYRAKLEREYGRASSDKITLEIAKTKKVCAYITASNSPLSNSKYTLEKFYQWMQKYVK